MGTRKKHEQYVDELAVKNPTIRVVGNYINTKTPIEHYCMKHKIIWNISPSNALKGNGCMECGKEKISTKNKRTHEEYVAKVAEINPNIEVIESYIDANTKILHKCKIDGYEWKIRPASILVGEGCPKCAGNINLTNDEYINKLE